MSVPETLFDNDVRHDWGKLRTLAEAARRQLAEGPTEWPGQPSRQRLELFLAASPDTILALLGERDKLAASLGTRPLEAATP